jgi:hypothetical protein
VPVVVRRYPATVRMTEAQAVPSSDSVSLRPMTIEERLKKPNSLLHRKKDRKEDGID